MMVRWMSKPVESFGDGEDAGIRLGKDLGSCTRFRLWSAGC